MATNTKRAPLTDAEREERRAAERELATRAVQALLSSEGWQHWLDVRRRFHSYSLANQLLIALQKPEATFVAGFKRWLKLGYCVRKGETAIRIWAPVPPSKAKLQAWRKAGGDPAEKPRTFFRLAAVFDRSQVAPLPDFPGGPVALDPPIEAVDGDSLAHLLGPLASFGKQIGSTVTIEPVPGEAHGYYELKTRRIVVDVTGEDFHPNGQVKTLIHELSHALVRADHQDDDPTLSYAEEEVVAETVAYCVCASVGLDTTGYSIPYLASWSHDAGGPEAINRYATLIDRLARRLETLTDEALIHVQKPAEAVA